MATGFDKATGDGTAEVIDDESVGSPIPRAVFTQEQVIDVKSMRVDQLRIAQAMSQEVKDKKATAGQLVLSNFMAMDEVICIPLAATPIRAYKPDARKPPVCHAPTGNFGFGNPGGVCCDENGEAICPLAKWTEPKPGKTKNTPPPCKEGMMVRMYSVTHRSIVDMQFMAGDRGKAQFIQQQSMSYAYGNFAVRISAEDKSNDLGSWSVPNIEMLGDAEMIPPRKDGKPFIDDKQWETAQKWYTMLTDDLSIDREAALIQLRAIN